MTYDPEAARIARIADQRVAQMNIPSAERAAPRKAEIDAIKMEEAQKAAAEKAGKARAEAEVERARIAAIVRAGRASGRARIALRLALSGPVDEKQARLILPGLPLDAAADADLTVPSPGTYGPPGAIAERTRLCAIFSTQLTADRFGAACALGLEGDAPASAVIAVLSSLPPEAKPRTAEEILTERATGLEEFGASHEAPAPVSRAAAGWAKAVAAANAHIGATASPAGGLADG